MSFCAMKLDLLIPYLLSPPTPSATLPACKILETLLAHSEQSPAQANYTHQLFALANLPADTSQSWLTALADNCAPQFYQWRADPVHFKAHADHAILLDSHSLAIQTNEAQQLVAHFNQHFADDGLQLFAATPERWYLQATNTLQVTTTTLAQSVGRNVRLFLPTGVDALRWRKILNETQMLFYAHAVNQQREAENQLTINSLWLWGEGYQPAVDAKSSLAFYVDEITVRGVARVLQTPCSSVAAWLQQPTHGLLVLDDLLLPASYGDAERWREAVQIICQNILPVVLRALKSGQITQLNVYPADGRCFSLRATDLRKFWRLRKPLSHWMHYEH